MFFQKTFLPSHAENRMESEGDLEAARAHFLKKRPPNLEYLLASRYQWMNAYIGDDETFLELGAGCGFSKEFLQKKRVVLTDYKVFPWIDKQVDALNLPFAPASMDGYICSHMIHHLAEPIPFFKKLAATLKPGGRVLISEINTSFFMRSLLYAMRHEGWDYSKDLFKEGTIANQPHDPWSANCAIPELLFQDHARFERETGLRIRRDRFCEFSIFPLSGGVIAKSKTIQLPRPILKLLDFMDRFLISLSPRVFALGRQVVLENPRLVDGYSH